MAKRSAQPALYEMMRGRDAGIPISTETEVEIGKSPPPRTALIEFKTSRWLAPGRLIRMPVGYVLIAAGVCVALLFIVYTMGVSRGKAAAKQESDTEFLNSPGAIVNDPLVSLAPNDAGKTPPSTLSNSKAAQSPATPATWGQIAPEKDPRRPGLNYLALMQTNEEGAVRFATFCRENGLETYVIRGKNPRIRKVIAFPGFQSSALMSKEVNDLRAKIQAIGMKWNEKEKRSDWKESLAELYEG